MINLTRVRDVLAEIEELVDDLDGIDLDETKAVESQTKGKARQERARRSQELQLLGNRLELAASLVRIEYWHARGEQDPLDPARIPPGEDAD